MKRMLAITEEGRIYGYRYAILEVQPGEHIWWAERPGGTTCWRGNCHRVPATAPEAKEQIIEMLATYGVGEDNR